MKFKGHARMGSSPSFTVDAKVEPVGFESSLGGAIEGTVGAIVASIEEFPIRLAIPFMKRRGDPPVVASIGGFKAKINPLSVKVAAESLHMKGIFGSKGIEGKIGCQVACRTEMEVQGRVGGKLGSVVLQLGSDDEFEETESS
jgi:hypothetical protein